MVEIMVSPEGIELSNIKIHLYPRYREILGIVNEDREKLRFAVPLNGKKFQLRQDRRKRWALLQIVPIIPKWPTNPEGVKNYLYLPLCPGETPNIGNLHACMV